VEEETGAEAMAEDWEVREEEAVLEGKEEVAAG